MSPRRSLGPGGRVRCDARAQPVTVTQANPVQPGAVVAAKPKEVGSAGVKGWDNQRCEYNSYLAGQAEEEAQAASKAGETKKAESKTAVANMLNDMVGKSCLVID